MAAVRSKSMTTGVEDRPSPHLRRGVLDCPQLKRKSLGLLLGSSLVALSPAMCQTKVFWLIGWAIVVSSMALILIPRQWHHRFGVLVLPTVVRHMKLYAVGLFAFARLLLYGVFLAGSQ
jgi:hypothetical protein